MSIRTMDSPDVEFTNRVTAFPVDSAGLAEIRTDETVELKPGDGALKTYQRRKGITKYNKSLVSLVPIRPKQK